MYSIKKAERKLHPRNYRPVQIFTASRGDRGAPVGCVSRLGSLRVLRRPALPRTFPSPFPSAFPSAFPAIPTRLGLPHPGLPQTPRRGFLHHFPEPPARVYRASPAPCRGPIATLTRPVACQVKFMAWMPTGMAGILCWAFLKSWVNGAIFPSDTIRMSSSKPAEGKGAQSAAAPPARARLGLPPGSRGQRPHLPMSTRACWASIHR